MPCGAELCPCCPSEPLFTLSVLPKHTSIPENTTCTLCACFPLPPRHPPSPFPCIHSPEGLVLSPSSQGPEGRGLGNRGDLLGALSSAWGAAELHEQHWQEQQVEGSCSQGATPSVCEGRVLPLLQKPSNDICPVTAQEHFQDQLV